MMRSLYWIAADMQNVELDLSFYDIFEYEELVGIWKTVNARMYVCNAAAPLNSGLMPRCAVPLLRNILESADVAIKKGTPAADLRFGHDTHLIRLLALMQIEGCSNQEADMEKIPSCLARLSGLLWEPICKSFSIVIRRMIYW